MKTTVEALKDLFKKLGGSNFGDTNTIPDAIDKVTTVATSGGGGADLPAAGAAGNVLTSDGEDWVSAAPVYAVAFTLGESGISVTGGVTISNIFAAYTSGKAITASIDFGGVPAELKLCATSQTKAVFFGVYYDAEDSTASQFIVYGTHRSDADTWDWVPIELLPTIDADDIGKILGVVSDGEDGAVYALVDAKDPLIISSTTSGSYPSIAVSITTALATIYAAAEAGREVILEVPLDGLGSTGKLRFHLGEYSYAGGEYDFTFGLTLTDSTSPAHYSVNFENAQSASLESVRLAVST